jgi:hypothetical protein
MNEPDSSGLWLKESAEKRGCFVRDASDLVRCLTIELEVELSLGSIVVPVRKEFEFASPQPPLRERGASDGGAHTWRLPRGPGLLCVALAEVTTRLAIRPGPPSFSLAKDGFLRAHVRV